MKTVNYSNSRVKFARKLQTAANRFIRAAIPQLHGQVRQQMLFVIVKKKQSSAVDYGGLGCSVLMI